MTEREKMVMSPIPDYGDHMTMEEFKKCCESGGFIDYDGHGFYATATEMSNWVIFPSTVTEKRIDKSWPWSHVVWFNR